MDNGDTSPVKQEIIRDDKGRFPPGVSGNPNGRPLKERLISDKLLQMLKEKPELINAIATVLLEMAIKNKDMQAIREILDRLEGKAVQPNELFGKDGGNVVIELLKYGSSDKTTV